MKCINYSLYIGSNVNAQQRLHIHEGCCIESALAAVLLMSDSRKHRSARSVVLNDSFELIRDAFVLE